MKSSNKKIIYIKELDVFGTEEDVDLIFESESDVEKFLKAWDVKTLNLILKTQVEKENYEQAAVIDNIIKEKNVKTKRNIG